MGINVNRVKLVTFLFAAAMTSYAGVLYAFLHDVCGTGSFWLDCIRGVDHYRICRRNQQSYRIGICHTAIDWLCLKCCVLRRNGASCSVLRNCSFNHQLPTDRYLRGIRAYFQMAASVGEKGGQGIMSHSRLQRVCRKPLAEFRPLTTFRFPWGNGKLLGIIGPNGAGKTTAFNLLTGVYPLDKGHVFLDNDKEISGLPQHIR